VTARRTGWAIATGLLAALVAGCGDAAPRRATATRVPATQVRLAGCFMTVEVFPMDRAPLRALVPARYALGSYAGADRATLVFWVIACDSARVGTLRPRPAILSLVGVQVKSPLHPSSPAGPGNFDHYLLFAHTNDRTLAHLLRRGGVPAGYVAGMHFARGRATTTGVPWRRGPYAETVRASVSQPAHDHDNSYWREASGGAVRLRIRFRGATDRACGQCSGSGISADPRSPLARILPGGELVGPFVAFDHDKIAHGEISLFAPQNPRPQPTRTGGGFLGVEGTTRAGVGVAITGVLPESPAARSGLRRGDVVLSVEGAAVRTFDQLVARVGTIRPGTRVALTILRGRMRLQFSVVLTARPGGS
jgi:hypothetical protein